MTAFICLEQLRRQRRKLQKKLPLFKTIPVFLGIIDLRTHAP